MSIEGMIFKTEDMKDVILKYINRDKSKLEDLALGFSYGLIDCMEEVSNLPESDTRTTLFHKIRKNYIEALMTKKGGWNDINWNRRRIKKTIRNKR